MVDLIEEAFRLQSFLEQSRFRFCFIGGIAVQHWGEPRLTRDIDISLLTGFGGEAPVIDRLLDEYTPRFADARQFALRNRVLLIATSSGVAVDVSLAALAFEEMTIERSVLVELSAGKSLRLCSPEDLIVMKVFAGRATDIRDVQSVIVRRGEDALDWDYIESSPAAFEGLKDDRNLIQELRSLRR